MNSTLGNYSRLERYRFAGKTLKYRVYVFLEVLFALVSIAAILAAILTENNALLWSLSISAVLLSALHHFSQLLQRPWIFLTCLVWSLIFYFLYDVWLAAVLELPKAGPLFLLIAGLCYLIRGEHLVNSDATASIAGMDSGR